MLVLTKRLAKKKFISKLIPSSYEVKVCILVQTQIKANCVNGISDEVMYAHK